MCTQCTQKAETRHIQVRAPLVTEKEATTGAKKKKKKKDLKSCYETKTVVNDFFFPVWMIASVSQCGRTCSSS